MKNILSEYTINSMSDEYIYASSLAPQETDFEFSSRQIVYIPDQNNGSYPNSQVIFDAASVSNSGKMISWSESFLAVPLVLNVNASVGGFAGATVENVFAASLKNGVHQLINSISVELTNNQIVNLTSFSNLDINYKILNRISSEELMNLAPSINFAKDSTESIGYSGAASLQGIGEYNNTIKQSLFATTAGWGTSSYTQNAGRAQRMLRTSFDPVSTNAANFTSTNNCNTSGKDYCVQTASNITYYIMATIPLRFMHDIFSKLPLMRGAYIRLILNLNAQSQCVLTLGSTGTTYSNVVSVSSPNGVLPFMLSPLQTTNGFVAAGTCTQVTSSLGIGKSVVPTTFSHPSFTQCRLYCFCYEFSPLIESRYFSAVPTKTIKYNDILSFQVLNVAPGASFNSLLSNGVSRLRSLKVFPFLSASMNGSATVAGQSTYTAGIGPLSTLNSPFSSAPGTCCPFARITNYNVLLSQQAIYQSNYQYGWETFLQEIRESEGINGGLSLGMSSGIISQTDWESGYGVLFTDLSRKISQASDDVSRSLQITGTNSSQVSLDLYAIVEYEREITISTSTGSLVI